MSGGKPNKWLLRDKAPSPRSYAKLGFGSRNAANQQDVLAR